MVQAKLPNCIVIANGSQPRFRDRSASIRTIKASCGIMSVLQLRHIDALKQHEPSLVYRSLTVPRGRDRQGRARLSDGELLSMITQNCPSSVRDVLLGDGIVCALAELPAQTRTL